MRICRIEIEEFGKLRDFCLVPGEGITLIEGGNESGKSTLLAFLRFALYGFPRKGSADGEERDKRLSWYAGRASGCLTLEWRGAEYRIFRRCVRRSGTRETVAEELSVLCLPENVPTDLGGKTPGEFFLGIPAELYDGSFCLTQSEAERVSAPGMGQTVGNLLFTGEAVFSAEAAEKRLQEARRELQHLKGGGGRITELETELSRLDGEIRIATEQGAELGRMREEMEADRVRITEYRRELSEVVNAIACADIDRTLALFEEKEAALRKEAECRASLEKIVMGAAAELPDKAYPARVEQALREAEEARERIAALTPLRERLTGVKYDEELLHGAALMEGVEHVDALPARVARHTARRKRRLTAGLVFLALAVMGIVAGVQLPTWRNVAMACCGVGALLCVALLCGAWNSGKKIGKLLREVGAKNVSMLRTYIEQCRREGQAHRANTRQLAEADAALAAATAAQAEAEACLRSELAAIGRTDVPLTREGVGVVLAALARRKGELQQAVSDGTVAYELAKSVVQTLCAQLEGKDENALRAMRAASPFSGESPEALGHRRVALEQMIGALEQRRGEAARAEAALAAVARDAEALLREREGVLRELNAAKLRLTALRMALEALRQAEDELRSSLIPRLREEATTRFQQLTGGVHGALLLDADFSVSVVEDGIPRPISHYSAGCRDAAHLALRMALTESVCPEQSPLLFDEAFARLDDTRAEHLLRMVAAYCRGGRQAILLTCHGRERRFLAQERDVVYVKMPK